MWPSMVTHTRNLSSAFNPSKCTLTAVNTHLEQWAAILRRPGSSWGIGALLKGLTSVVVLKVERALVIHSPHRQSLPESNRQPLGYKSNSLTIRPRLPSLTTQIQPISRPEPREDHNISGCQWRPCQLDVSYRQIPCEDLVSSTAISTTELSRRMTSLNQ